MTTALQTVSFDFYGDSLIAVKDNSSNEIYAAITHILRGIGFSKKQIEYQIKKITTDILFKFFTKKFPGSDLGLPNVNEIWCISNRRLPMMLTKIRITPKMKREHPEVTDKLLIYQDKCADVLAQVFIDKTQIIDRQTLIDLTDKINSLNETMCSMKEEIIELKSSLKKPMVSKSKNSKWAIRMFPKYQALMDYFHIDRTKLYHNLFLELQNIYPDINLNQLKDDYCQENEVDECFTLDVIENSNSLRVLFEGLVDGLLEKYHLDKCPRRSRHSCKTIFR